VSAYLAEADTPALNLGCGPNLLDGWLNTDRDPRPGAFYLDATHPFGLPDDSVRYVFSEHMIEHLPVATATDMLRECRRVLQPGGTLRIATPDLERICALVGADRSPVADDYVRWSIRTFLPGAPDHLPAFAVNQLFRAWGHRFLYDFASLEWVLREAGFEEVRRCEYGDSDDPFLRGLEQHGGSDEDRARVAFETMVVQARRRR
jgi:predicted SAM-dependent methyltransferase